VLIHLDNVWVVLCGVGEREERPRQEWREGTSVTGDGDSGAATFFLAPVTPKKKSSHLRVSTNFFNNFFDRSVLIRETNLINLINS